MIYNVYGTHTLVQRVTQNGKELFTKNSKMDTNVTDSLQMLSQIQKGPSQITQKFDETGQRQNTQLKIMKMFLNFSFERFVYYVYDQT